MAGLLFASKRITGISYGTPFQYNSGYPTKFIAGDTWCPTWADDDNIYTPHCDTEGWEGTQGAPVTSANMAMSKISAFDSSVTGTLVNAFSAFGAFSTTGSDGNTFKTGGHISINGSMYLFACREHYGASGTGWLQTGVSAQLIKTSDHWTTFTPAPPSTNEPYISPMFTSPKFGVPNFIQYGKDYQGNTAHNSGTYVYAIASTGWNNGDVLYLGRVSIANIGNLSAADWTFYTGGDGMLDSNWSSSVSSAVPILTSPVSLGQAPAQYIPAFDCYALHGWYYPSIKDSGGVTNTTSDVVWVTYASKTPWGWPGQWEVVAATRWSPQGYYNPVIIPKSVNGNTAVIACAGDYNTFSNYATGFYTLTLIPVTFS